MPIADVYSQLTSVWDRVRADALSHLWLFFFLWLSGYRLRISVDMPSYAVIESNVWYQIGHEIGLAILSATILAVVLFAYYAFLQFAGAVIATPFLLMFQGALKASGAKVLLAKSVSLDRIAATLPQGRRGAYEIMDQHDQLLVKYSREHKDELAKINESFSYLHRSSFAYFRDFSFFLIVFIILCVFNLHPRLPVSFTEGNPFLLTFFLIVALWVSARRLGNATRLIIGAYTEALVADIEADERHPLPQAGTPERGEFDRETGAARTALQRFGSSDVTPSLVRFGWRKVGPKCVEPIRRSRLLGWHRKTLGSGASFADHHAEKDGSDWLYGYVAYRYYRISNWLRSIGRAMRQSMLLDID